MKAVRSGLFSCCLVPSGVLGLQGERTGVMRVVRDELQILEDLTLLFDLSSVGPVVVDREHNRPTRGCDFLTVNIFHVHQQCERAAFHFSAEVVGGAEFPSVTSDKQVGGDVLNVERHGSVK